MRKDRCLVSRTAIYESTYFIEHPKENLIQFNSVGEEHHNIFFPFSDVNICAHSPVSLHLLGMSSQPEVFSVHINGQVLQQNGHKVSSVGLISSSTATVSMVALHTGRWLISSHTVKHMEGNDTSRPPAAFSHIAP